MKTYVLLEFLPQRFGWPSHSVHKDENHIAVELTYGLHPPDETKCKVVVPSAYTDLVKACENLWELQALCRKQSFGQSYLSTDNDMVDVKWLDSVGAIRYATAIWGIPLAVNWVDHIWIRLNVNNLIPDAYVAKEFVNNYDLVDPLPALSGTVKQMYFDYCGQELKQRS